MLLDLDKSSTALRNIRDGEANKALESLYGDLKKFRSKLGITLNDAEFRYVMQTLFNEQVITVSAAEAQKLPEPVTLAHGFTIRAVI